MVRVNARRFATYCAPRAVAALTGLPAVSAARVLARAQEARGKDPDGETASLADVVTALEAAGLEAETYDPRTAEPARGVEEVLAGYRPEVRQEARSLLSDPEARSKIVQQVEDRARPPRLTVSQFLEKRPRGQWLLTCWREGRRPHVIAARDGRLIAGAADGRYWGEQLETVHRIEGETSG